MTIKQRGTPLDAILLKVILPFLFSSGLRKQLPRWQLWHTNVSPKPAPSHVLNLAPRRSPQKAQPHPSAALGHKRAA